MQTNQFAIVFAHIDQKKGPLVFIPVLVKLDNLATYILRKVPLHVINFDLLSGIFWIIFGKRTQKLEVSVLQEHANDKFIIRSSSSSCLDLRSEYLFDLALELEVVRVESLHEDVVEREDMPVRDEDVGLQEHETREQLALVLYPLVEHLPELSRIDFATTTFHQLGLGKALSGLQIVRDYSDSGLRCNICLFKCHLYVLGLKLNICIFGGVPNAKHPVIIEVNLFAFAYGDTLGYPVTRYYHLKIKDAINR
jgi:hypothetical protein